MTEVGIGMAIAVIGTIVGVVGIVIVSLEELRHYRKSIWQKGFLAGVKSTKNAKVVDGIGGRKIWIINGLFDDEEEEK
jgi:hypothetical protein|tara:strand:- start:124 stop:357 length:234 start_codon:yes stop_codon:yes gene_type:complete